jgi:hypothetical protein
MSKLSERLARELILKSRLANDDEGNISIVVSPLLIDAALLAQRKACAEVVKKFLESLGPDEEWNPDNVYEAILNAEVPE